MSIRDVDNPALLAAVAFFKAEGERIAAGRPSPRQSMSLWRAMEECPDYEKSPGCCTGAVCTFAWSRRRVSHHACFACLRSRGVRP